MANLVRCDHGHVFDADVHATCPFDAPHVPRFIRCPGCGHVYDAAASARCPVCPAPPPAVEEPPPRTVIAICRAGHAYVKKGNADCPICRRSGAPERQGSRWGRRAAVLAIAAGIAAGVWIRFGPDLPGYWSQFAEAPRPAQELAAQPLSDLAEQALKPGDRFKECAACPEMTVIPAGSFMMGSPAGESERYSDEG